MASCQPLDAGFPADRLTGTRSRDHIAGCLSLSLGEVASEAVIIVLRSLAAIDAGHCCEDAATIRLVAGVGGEENAHVRRPRGYTGLHMVTVRCRRAGGGVSAIAFARGQLGIEGRELERRRFHLRHVESLPAPQVRILTSR